MHSSITQPNSIDISSIFALDCTSTRQWNLAGEHAAFGNLAEETLYNTALVLRLVSLDITRILIENSYLGADSMMIDLNKCPDREYYWEAYSVDILSYQHFIRYLEESLKYNYFHVEYHLDEKGCLYISWAIEDSEDALDKLINQKHINDQTK